MHYHCTILSGKRKVIVIQKFKDADKYKRRQTHVAILEDLHVSPLQKLPY